MCVDIRETVYKNDKIFYIVTIKIYEILCRLFLLQQGLEGYKQNNVFFLFSS